MAPARVGDLDHRYDRELADARRPLQLRRACNLAVPRATGDIVAFVNPDVSISCANLERLESDLRWARLGLLVPLLSSTRGARPRHQIFPSLPWRWVLFHQSWSHFIPR